MQTLFALLGRRPLAAMLLFSAGLHLVLALGAVAPVPAPVAGGVTGLQVSLATAKSAEVAAPVPEPRATAQKPTRGAGLISDEPAPRVAARKASAAPAETPRPEPSRRPALAETPPAEPVRPEPPAQPAPTGPETVPEPQPGPRHAPDVGPEPEDPFQELLSDQQEVVASAQPVAGPVAREPEWRQAPRPPAYPKLARRRGQEGEVMLRLDIDARGEVTGARVLASSGYPLLDSAAREAGLGWHLVPARVDGIAVASYVTIPVHFRLKD